MHGIIKHFTTTRKSYPGKGRGQKLKLMDREVRLFHQYISKNRHLAVADLEDGQDRALEKRFLKHVCVNISKDVATHSINQGISHSSLQRINIGVLQGPNLT